MKKQTPKKKCLQFLKDHFKKWSVSMLTLITLLFPATSPIFSHGTVTYPPSRVWICFLEDPESPDSPACQAAVISHGTQAFYDWNEVARMDAFGMHQEIIMDGNLASAGRPDKYGGLDQVRDDWVATPVSPGPFTVTWTNSAPHETLYFDVYITKADWTPDQPLTWDSLERLVRTEPRPAASVDNIDVVLPQRTGKHVIYSIWQRSLTGEAFYSTSDVDFGEEPGPNEEPVGNFKYDNGLCGGSDVNFDAGDSYDPDGDFLTYYWDFGDGTFAEGREVGHSFVGMDEATVSLTVSDGALSNTVTQTISLLKDPDCEEPYCAFDAPISTPLPSINASYEYVYVIGENGPNLDNITSMSINWSLPNDGLYQFSVNTNDGNPGWYSNLGAISTHNFSEAQPQVTITGSGFEGLDGTYFVTIDDGNFVLVSFENNFSIYFSNSETAPDCDGGTGTPINTAPVAALTATPISGVEPLIVAFDASGSSDIDGDALSYSIDYGDGTTGTDAVSTHVYAAGDYTAVVTVSDGKGGTDTASVAISVDPSDIPSGNCTFDTPRSTSLPTINDSYEYAYVLGTGGPNLDDVSRFTVNWDALNNGLYQFSFNLNVGPWYINFSNADQNFNEPNSAITLTNTGIAGLDGTYYATVDNGNFVLVANSYTIYFSNSDTAPNCTFTSEKIDEKSVETDLKLILYPNPTIDLVTVSLPPSDRLIANKQLVVTNILGQTITVETIGAGKTFTTIDLNRYDSGIYMIAVYEENKFVKSYKIVKK